MGAVVSKDSIQTDNHESLHARARKFGKNENTQLTSAVDRHVVAAEPFVHTQPDSRPALERVTKNPLSSLRTTTWPNYRAPHPVYGGKGSFIC